jgi:hypothetical protein
MTMPMKFSVWSCFVSHSEVPCFREIGKGRGKKINRGNGHKLPSLSTETVRKPTVQKCGDESEGLRGGWEKVDLIHREPIQGLEPDSEVIERLRDDAVKYFFVPNR